MATPTLTRRGVNAAGYLATLSIPSGNRRAVERALARMAAQLDAISRQPQFVLTAAGRQALEVAR